MKLSSAAIDRAERIRSLVNKSAYRTELTTGVAPSHLKAPSDLTDLLNKFSDVRGTEAQAAAIEINAAKDPLDIASKLLPGVNEQVLNYLMSQCSYKYFCLKYFREDFFARPMAPAYHDVYFDLIREVETHRTSTPTIVAGPPEWGKTTIGGVILPLHCVVFDNMAYLPDGREVDLTKRFVGLITVVEKNARRTLETIKDQLENNDAIRRDFGEFYRVPGSRGRNEPWSETVAVTLNERRIEIFGRSGKIRGAMWKGHRLDLPIGDDLEDDENCNSIIRQDRDYKWLKMVVNRTSKERGNVLILGNLVNPNGLLDRCVKEGQKKGWRVEVFRLYTENPETKEKIYTWPDEFGPEYEKLKREITGDENFEAEFLSNPEAYNREVHFDDIKEYRFDNDFIENVLPRCVVYSAADPASSVSAKADFTAVVSLAEDATTGTCYMLPSINEKVPTGLHADLILDVQQQWHPVMFGVESIAYQNALVDRLEERRRERGNMYFYCIPITHPYLLRKKERIAQRLFKRILDGALLFPENDKVARICADQIVNLKTALHDDVADALEMAMRIRDKDMGMRSGMRVSVATAKVPDPIKEPTKIDLKSRLTLVALSPDDPKFVRRRSKRETLAEST